MYCHYEYKLVQYFLKGVDNYNNMSLAQIVLTVT